MLFKMDVKPNFSVENEAAISAPPKVDFNKPPAAAPAPAPAPAPKTSGARSGGMFVALAAGAAISL